jgi:hypothetical protein
MNYYYKCERYNYCPHIREGKCLRVLSYKAINEITMICRLNDTFAKHVKIEQITQIQYYMLKAILWSGK